MRLSERTEGSGRYVFDLDSEEMLLVLCILLDPKGSPV